MQVNNARFWLLWVLLSVGIAAYLMFRLLGEETDKTVFLPGATSDGHHQIELACNACHTGPYADQDALQEACEGCHLETLKAAKDDHPKSKFTDPRNADRIAVLDARYCVTCHVEHRPEITDTMGLTLPADTCFLCHENIADDRPSHEGMAFDTCLSAGCHNFHDNRALYEDFLVKHMDDVDILYGEQLFVSNLREIAEQLPDYPLDAYPIEPLSAESQAAHASLDEDGSIMQEWLASSHAAAGVGCDGCHVAAAEEAAEWVDKPDHSHCAGCHAGEVAGFLQGRHGMRLDVALVGRELSPMTPALARLPMKEDAMHETLDCQSCHGAHSYESRTAAVDSCLTCHNDEHSLAYLDSPHAELWRAEMDGSAPPGTGVSCASCHMPRVDKDYFWGTFVHYEVQHNQSANLQPNEKMLRPVCMNCHGLGFGINALADPELILNNFANPPSVHIESIDLARQRVEAP
ncbi:MAG: cytochrome c3 family protein [Pseudomonadota bacterium]